MAVFLFFLFFSGDEVFFVPCRQPPLSLGWLFLKTKHPLAVDGDESGEQRSRGRAPVLLRKGGQVEPRCGPVYGSAQGFRVLHLPQRAGSSGVCSGDPFVFYRTAYPAIVVAF